MKQLYFKDPDGYSICFQWPDKKYFAFLNLTGLEAVSDRLFIFKFS